MTSSVSQTGQIIGRLTALANVVSVVEGSTVNGRGPDHLEIIAYHPAPFETIAELTKGFDKVDVTVATKVPSSAADRFRENQHVREVYDRHGNHATPGEAKLFAANIGIDTPPTLAAIHGDKLGVLFASIEDAQAYDRAEPAGNVASMAAKL